MRFECGDLERALAISELMPEVREHLKTCAACRREYRLWSDISTVAKTLHEDWDSPALWSKIRTTLEAERKPAAAWWRQPGTWVIAATLAVAVSILLFVRVWHHDSPAPQTSAQTLRTDRDFLTEQALADVEKSEATYRRSIERLSRLAAPKLERTKSPTALNAQEKLLLLDSAITETRTNVAGNRFNVRLQTTLADLYREKQQTLEELLKSNAKN